MDDTEYIGEEYDRVEMECMNMVQGDVEIVLAPW